MASANLRYLALRSRLQALLNAHQTMLDQQAFAEQLLNEMYRALAQLSALVVYRAEADRLIAIATRGPVEHTTLPKDAGIPGAALASGTLIAVPDRSQDARALPTTQSFSAELAIPLLQPNAPPLVLAALIAQPQALGYGDRELFSWLAHLIAQPE